MIYLICRWFNELFAPAPFSSRFFPPTFLLQAIHFHCGMSTAILWMNIFFLVWWPLPAIACIKSAVLGHVLSCHQNSAWSMVVHHRRRFGWTPTPMPSHALRPFRPFSRVVSAFCDSLQWSVPIFNEMFRPLVLYALFFRRLWVLSACLILIPLFFLICCMFSVGFMPFVLSWHFSSPFVCLP